MCVFAAGATGLFGLGAGASNLFLGSLGLNLATGLAGRSAAQSKADGVYQSALITNESAEQSLALQQEALADNLKDTRASKAQESLSKTIAMLEAKGAIRASEQSGLTVQVLLMDEERQAANQRESINQELESFGRQYTRNVEGLVASRDNRRNQLQSNINQAYNQIPTLGSVILNTATQGFNTFAQLAWHQVTKAQHLNLTQSL